jgi:hypothetical protein
LILLNELTTISSGLSSAVKNYLEQGGNVALFPAKNADLTSYNTFLAQINAGRLEGFDTTTRVVNYFNADEFVFNDVFERARGNIRLPTTKGNFNMTSSLGSAEKLLGYRDGKSYLSKYLVGKGNFYQCSAPLTLAYNNLVTQAEVFIPMLYKMALSASKKTKIAYAIGSDQYIEIENNASGAEVVYKVQGPSNFIPGQISQGKRVTLSFHDQVQEAGFYDIYLRDDEVLHTVAFNSDRLESNPACISATQLQVEYAGQATIVGQTQQANIGEFIQEKEKGIVLWKYCLILTLIFLALETLIIRFWSV